MEMATTSSNIKTINPFGLPYGERWSRAEVEKTVELFDLDDNQKEQLLELKSRLKDVAEYWMNGPFELSRFVLEPTCYGNVRVMEKRFRKCREWRRAEGLDTILETYSPPGYAFRFPGGIMEHPDRNGDWVVVMRQGEPLELIRRYGKEEIIQALLWGNEFNFRGPWIASPQRKRRPTVGTAIIDLKGLAPRHYHPALLTIAANVAQPLQLHYPYMLKKVLVINAPKIFYWIWSTLIRHLVFAHLRELIEIASTEVSEQVVDQYVDIRILPKQLLNGKGTGKAVQPWMNPRWEIGVLPPEGSSSHEDEWERPPLVYGPDTIWQQQQQQQQQQQKQQYTGLDDKTTSTAASTTTNTKSRRFNYQSSSSSLSTTTTQACGATSLFKGSWIAAGMDGSDSSYTIIQIR